MSTTEWFIDFTLINFSLTVKMASLIFISRHGSAVSSAKQGNSGYIYKMEKSKKIVWAAQTRVHFM